MSTHSSFRIISWIQCSRTSCILLFLSIPFRSIHLTASIALDFCTLFYSQSLIIFVTTTPTKTKIPYREREREANKRKQIFERTTKMGKLISWGKRKGFWMMSSTDARSLLVFSPFIFRSLKMQLKISQKTAYYSFCQGTINQSNANTVQISNRFSCAFFFSRWKIEVDRVCHVWLIFFHRYVRFESSDRIIFSNVFFFCSRFLARKDWE